MGKSGENNRGLSMLLHRLTTRSGGLAAGLRCFSSASGLRVSAVIERRPVIYHMEPWEEEYEQWSANSKDAQYGRQEVKSILTLQNKTSGMPKGKAAKQDQAANTRTSERAAGLEAEYESLKRFNVTDADRSGDRTTLMRALDRRLYLLVNSEQGYSFPTVSAPSDVPSLRSVAEELASNTLAPFEPYMFGNAPIGHLDASHFFFYGEIVWLHGQLLPDVSKMGSECVWVTRDELSEYLEANVLECAQKMLTKI